MSKNTNTTKDIGAARSKYNKNSMVTDQNQKSMVDGTDSIQDDIPLADDETVAEITDSDLIKLNYANITGPEKLEKLQQQKARRHNSETNLKRPDSPGTMAARLHQQQQQQQPNSLDVNCDLSQEEIDENEKLVQKVLELQNTLDALSTRVQAVREENHKLMSENQVLSQYIENLVAASSVFQATPGKNGQNSQNTQQQQQQSELQSSRTNRTNNKDTHSNSAMAAKK